MVQKRSTSQRNPEKSHSPRYSKSPNGPSRTGNDRGKSLGVESKFGAQSSAAELGSANSHRMHGLRLRHVWTFLSLGLFFHVFYIMSIFDIYFRSPLVKNLPSVSPVQPAPAKRLVLFVGDGLRADKCFELDEKGQPRSPFLRRMARERGAWGISHTRVPTESRPGHVAMIAGFYEDVSAVTKGWKSNPVEFDHILRRARYSWAMGCPDIVQLFTGENVTGLHYSEAMIDFSKDAIELDRWSFDTLRELFELAHVNPGVAAKLHSDQVVIFVHLLGLDTNGHAYRPHSREYHENVAFVDKKVAEAVAMIDSFYADNLTSYIFTSDHGMSNAGAHGDGDPDNTRCPLVLWGAGISQPIPTFENRNNNHYGDMEWTNSWGLNDIVRRDIRQADLAPLMATLVGIPIPTNSEGVLPIELLGTSDEFRSRATLVNLRQLLTTFTAREGELASQEPFFRQYFRSAKDLTAALNDLSQLIDEGGKYENALTLMAKLRADIFAGLLYYQKYDWLLLRSVVAIGYLSWMAYAILYLGKQMSQAIPTRPSSRLLRTTAIILAVTSIWFLVAKRAPVQYYFYFAFPLWFCYSVAMDLHDFGLDALGGMLGPLHSAPVYVSCLEILVTSFFQRRLLSIITPALALILISLLRGTPARFKHVKMAFLGALFTIVGVFPFLEPIKEAHPLLLYSGVGLIIAFSLFIMIADKGHVYRPLVLLRVGAVLVAALLVWQADRLFATKQGLPLSNQIAAWLLLAYSIVTPFLPSPVTPIKPLGRLLDIFLSFAPAYVILSLSYEPLFYVCFGAPLLIWVMFQQERPCKPPHRTGQLLDPLLLFLALKLLTFVLLSFFGTGNFASIASFALPSVYRLVTRFSPFLMATLLIGKLLIPICLLAAVFGAMIKLLHVPPVTVFLLLIATVDVMTLNFFFLVRDHGSWMEIGTSISHFIIASFFSLLALVIFGLSQVLLRGVTFPEPLSKLYY